MNKERMEFVTKCGELLRMAKPHLVSCELKLGKDIPPSLNLTLVPEDEYVVVTCDNGYSYKICVDGNSLSAIASDIFSKMAHK
jgi:hypothetical protein